MKLFKKKMMILIVAIAMMIIALLTGSVQAASQEFGLQEYRKARSDGAQYGYKVSDKYVWKIVTYSGSAINYDRTLYCLKAEQGFFTAKPGVFKETYDLSYDFMNKNSMSTLPVPSQYYDSIVWILNHAYIPSASTASTDRAKLLSDAGITGNIELTDDDIDVVQQLAIWYFTNYDDSTYHKEFGGQPSFQTVLESKKESGGATSEYKAIEDTNLTRYDQMNRLFVYLVSNAENATSNGNTTGVPLSMSNQKPSLEVNGTNYIIGPFKVSKNNDTPYTVSFSITDQSGKSLDGKYTLLDSNKNATNKTLDQLIGSNFYLRIPINTINSENITNIEIAMNGSYTTTKATYWTKTGNSTVQPIVEVTRTPNNFSASQTVIFPSSGSYNLKLIKVDSADAGKKLQGAVFKITSPLGTTTETTNSNGEINIGPIKITASGTETITIEETQAPAGYDKIITSPITIRVTTTLSGNQYSLSNAQITNPQTGASLSLSGTTINVTVQNKLKPNNSEYNLKLVKVEQGNTSKKLQGAQFKITSPLGTTTQTTNENGEINVGPIDVTATGTDTITIEETKAPDGYEKVINSPITVQVTKVFQDNTYKMSDAKITNSQNGASLQLSGNTITVTVENKLIPKTSEYNFKLIKVEEGNTSNKLQGAEFKITTPKGTETQTTDSNGEINIGPIEMTEEGIDTITIEETKAPTGYEKIITDPITVQVTKTYEDNTYSMSDAQITNPQTGASISLSGNTITVTVENKANDFDLALRKFITGKNDETITGREPQVDVTHLKDGTDTTAIYNHPKDTIDMAIGDVVIYTIRVYNEGSMDGYANEITDYLPEELEFLPNNEINQEYEWQVSEDGRTVTTDYLSKEQETTPGGNLLKAFDGNTLDYKDVKIAVQIKDTATVGKKLTNLAEITIDKDSNGDDVDDRDSTPDNVDVPNDEDLPNYKDDESDQDYVPGQEDDDDFEKVRVVYFDLALRKFITAVDDQEITNRIPQLSIGEDGNIHYDHTKDPVEVENGDIVTYTLRIFNEGLMDGYASLIKDDVPDGLQFLPDNETNKEYRWVVSEDGKTITTDYLSKEQEKEEGANLIKAFNPELGITDTNPDYRDIKIAFLVTEPNTSDRILVNTAEIADDRDKDNKPVEDIDSTPNNDNDWNEEDDLDKEFVKVKYFDLSLKKWVSKAIITNEDGSVTVQETGHTGDENPEPPAKVDLGRQDINKVTVKFEFQIKVTNEGEIAGYAKEVTDYIPEGLRFIQEDNPEWYPRDSLNGQERVGTRQLENTLLQPGESATVSIILTWINGQDNMGLKTNVAEISEDYNDSHTPDIDSTPDNDVPGEDDIDDAPVMLTVKLGDTPVYIGLGFVIVAMLTSGVWAIKRFVL